MYQYVDGSDARTDPILLDISSDLKFYGYIENHEWHYFRLDNYNQTFNQSYYIEIQGAYAYTLLNSRNPLQQLTYSVDNSGILQIFHLPQFNSNYFFYLDISHINDGSNFFY